MPRKNEPQTRTCIASRETRPVEALLRFVLDPEGEVVPDLRRRLPGRGVWVSANRAAVALAEKRRLFARAFKADVKIAPGLSDRVEALYMEGAVAALSFARKAGEVVTGFTKVETAIASGKAIALIHAAEAAEDGVEKLDRAFRRQGGVASAHRSVRIFSSAQLDLAFGRTNVIHAALLAGRASHNVLERVAALARFREEDGPLGVDPQVSDEDDPSGTFYGAELIDPPPAMGLPGEPVGPKTE
ncbi:RNA-binding protein [Prosthecomicrobium pneumaticum]|uniref:YlxR domain-containing protein n=1 Tax=Prosthecomicrobium pneumaticum TaxID=81895 RepID=A0A7W9L310_9HYPH|nr:hypothetical protein [Prosthecomicrobium pneumaticum]